MASDTVLARYSHTLESDNILGHQHCDINRPKWAEYLNHCNAERLLSVSSFLFIWCLPPNNQSYDCENDTIIKDIYVDHVLSAGSLVAPIEATQIPNEYRMIPTNRRLNIDTSDCIDQNTDVSIRIHQNLKDRIANAH